MPETIEKTCQTCLYMATHENCDHCLSTSGDFREYYLTGKMPPYRYANYKEGNWMKRVSQHELDGKRNIVIGGQGEAEVNTHRTPQETAKNLHYVAEQCGYIVGALGKVKQDGSRTLQITTAEGCFRLVWINDQLERIEQWSVDYDWDTDTDNSKHLDNYWDRQFIADTVMAMAD